MIKCQTDGPVKALLPSQEVVTCGDSAVMSATVMKPLASKGPNLASHPVLSIGFVDALVGAKVVSEGGEVGSFEENSNALGDGLRLGDPVCGSEGTVGTLGSNVGNAMSEGAVGDALGCTEILGSNVSIIAGAGVPG
jgi:hypothetical protein